MVLGEVEGNRKLPIVIGGAEAQAIAIEIEKMKASRPLTHDLFKSAFGAFGIRVLDVIIYNMVEGVFFAKMHCVSDEKTEEIDCRPSDAVAIAYRFGCLMRRNPSCKWPESAGRNGAGGAEAAAEAAEDEPARTEHADLKKQAAGHCARRLRTRQPLARRN